MGAAMISMAVGGIGAGLGVGLMMATGVSDYVCSKYLEIYQSAAPRG
jgi:F0F1-type ATP synthase membrane subunit c/vacuolar-type H+-ATPase subunit K